MNQVNKKSILMTGLSSLMLVILAACGPQSSKSLGDYSNLKKKLGPVHNTPSPVQTYVPSNLFLLEIDRATSTHFIVGQRNVVRFVTALNLPGTKYRLVSNDLPRGAEPLKDLGRGVWEFAWTPGHELIPQNGVEPIRGGFHVSFDVYEITNPQSRNLLASLSTERVVDYTLLRSGAIPEITEITGVAAYPQVTKITEGDVLNLTITVKDPTATSSQKPRLIPVALPNRITPEQSKISGHGFLFLETDPTMIKPGVWQFKAIFDTKNNPVPEFNIEGRQSLAPHLLADLAIQVLSPNRTISPIKTLTFEITYRRELLKPAFRANPELQVVYQNATFVYDFESYLPSPIGTITNYLADETVKMPGSPKLRCKIKNRENQLHGCKIEWKIPCSVTPGDYTLKVVAAAEYQGQNTSMELLQKVSVAQSKKCPAPKSTAPVTTDPAAPNVEPNLPPATETVSNNADADEVKAMLNKASKGKKSSATKKSSKNKKSSSSSKKKSSSSKTYRGGAQ